jgi:tetrahydromethanopterin S-methyltransferase subunit G
MRAEWPDENPIVHSYKYGELVGYRVSVTIVGMRNKPEFGSELVQTIGKLWNENIGIFSTLIVGVTLLVVGRFLYMYIFGIIIIRDQKRYSIHGTT